jgi:hypothetical protein
LQSIPATIVMAGSFDLQFAAAKPSPSSSLAENTQTPCSALHFAVAHIAGVVTGETQSESDVHDGPVVLSEPASLVVAWPLLPFPPHAPAAHT